MEDLTKPCSVRIFIKWQNQDLSSFSVCVQRAYEEYRLTACHHSGISLIWLQCSPWWKLRFWLHSITNLWSVSQTRHIHVLLVKWKLLSRVWLFVTPWTIQPMEFSRQEYWSGLPFPSPGDIPNPGIEPKSPALQADSLPAEPQGTC